MTAKTAIPLATVLTLAMARPAAAVDGVIEINQARALAGGVTASDTAGFPVTIDSSGSYRLTGNLTVPDANTTAIVVTTGAEAVDIDLNGFAIVGPVTCTPPAPSVTCSPSGVGRGIDRPGNGASRLRVTHGAVRGMGDSGIAAAGALVVEGVEAMYNAKYGIAGNDNSQVTGCEASRNGLSGILVLTNSSVRNCAAMYNGEWGIVAFAGSVIEHNQTELNVQSGIFVKDGCTVIGNTSSNNQVAGILINGTGSTVLDNAVRDNDLAGLHFNYIGGYARNVLTGNNGGDANPQAGGSGIEIGTNICGTDTVCP